MEGREKYLCQMAIFLGSVLFTMLAGASQNTMVERDPWDTLRADKSLDNLDKTPTGNRALMAPCNLAEGVHLGCSSSNKVNA